MLFKRTTITATALVAGLALSSSAIAGGYQHYSEQEQQLPKVDSFVKTIVDKSVIAGEIARGADGQIAFDSNGKLMFDYTGDVFSMKIDDDNGELEGLDEKIGTIKGQAAFPMEFAMLAIGMKAYMYGVGPMPTIPNKIDWTCNNCEMTVGENTYVSVVDAANAGAPFNAQAVEDLRMQARAFMGLGPVEVGQISQESLTVRMAGCSAVVGVAGPDAGKLGTICVNSTVAFDLAGIDLNNPFASHITATGTSNCVTVLHNPLSM